MKKRLWQGFAAVQDVTSYQGSDEEEDSSSEGGFQVMPLLDVCKSVSCMSFTKFNFWINSKVELGQIYSIIWVCR